jgi:hypothetical protein
MLKDFLSSAVYFLPCFTFTTEIHTKKFHHFKQFTFLGKLNVIKGIAADLFSYKIF